MSFGQRIKEARKAKGLTQSQLAEFVGVAKTTISGYESGNSEPGEEKIISIMKALDVDANYLWQDSMNPVERTLPSDAAVQLGFAYDNAPDNVKRAIKAMLEPYQNHMEAADELAATVSIATQEPTAEEKAAENARIAYEQTMLEENSKGKYYRSGSMNVG
jgi:transcriptional regulator with XRE-family HTH domain